MKTFFGLTYNGLIFIFGVFLEITMYKCEKNGLWNWVKNGKGKSNESAGRRLLGIYHFYLNCL